MNHTVLLHEVMWFFISARLPILPFSVILQMEDPEFQLMAMLDIILAPGKKDD